MYLTFIFLAVICLPLLVMILQIKKRVSPYRVVLEGVIAGAVGAVFVLILAAASGHGVYEEIRQAVEYMAKSLAENPALTDAMKTEDTAMADRIEFFTKVYEPAADLIPATVCIVATVAAYIEYIFLSKIVKPQGTRAIQMPKFREFTLPRSAITGWLGIYLLSWIVMTTRIMPSDLLYTNINVLFNFVFCLQGMSVLFMYCYKKRAPKAIAVIIILFFLSSVFGKWLLLIMGFADLILGLKARLK